MPAPDFPKNAQQLTPYANFRFKLKWDDGSEPAYVAGVSKVSGLKRKVAVVKHREGGDPRVQHLAPGQTSYAALRLERGVSYDAAFEVWANKVFDLKNSAASAGKDTSLGEFRRDLVIEVYNEAGQLVLSYNVYNCWVSEFNALSELDAMGNAVVIESMTLQNEGWERDMSVAAPTEPRFSDPRS